MFIDKFINKNVIIKEISSIPKDYALTEEEILYYVKDNSLDEYKPRDIVFVSNYKYENGIQGSNHLFVIIDQNNLVPIDYFGLLISSHIDKVKYKSNIYLKRNNFNNLKKDSIVKTDVVYKLNKENIKFKIGEVSIEEFNTYLNIIKKGH